MRLAQGQVRSFLADRARAPARPVKHPKAMQAMMRMKKLDIAELERAAKEAAAAIHRESETNADQLGDLQVRAAHSPRSLSSVLSGSLRLAHGSVYEDRRVISGDFVRPLSCCRCYRARRL